MADGSVVTTAPKLCVNCKHFRRDRSWFWFLLFPPLVLGLPWFIRYSREFAKCAVSPVSWGAGAGFIDGRQSGLLYCSVTRTSGVKGRCGEAGTLFVAKAGE